MTLYARKTAATLAMLLMPAPALLGCKATPPSRAETQVVTWTKHRITVGGRNEIIPIPATTENIDQGKQLFTSYCMVCHGLDGQNTGIPFTVEMSPPVPSLASPIIQSYTDGQLKWIIQNGIFPSGMPASEGDFSNEEMWQMVLYMRHLPPKGSLGAPKIYSGSGS